MIDCPPSGAVGTIAESNCVFDLEQVIRFGFQRYLQDDGTANEIVVATSDPKLKATWTALITANDDTKVQFTPLFGNPEFTPGDPRSFGGDNSTPKGVTKFKGTNPTGFVARIYGKRQDIIKSLKALSKEVSNLGVYFVNNNEEIWCRADDLATPTKYMPVKVESLFVGDLTPGGLDEGDYNEIRVQFAGNWSDDLIGFKPTDFMPSLIANS